MRELTEPDGGNGLAGPAVTPPADPAGRWTALAILAVAELFAMTTWFSATAALPQLAQRWSLSATGEAWLTIAVQVGFVTGALVSASLTLADLLPPRRLILFGAVGAATVNALLLIAGGGTTAILLRLATGFFLAGVYPPALKSMSTWFRRGRGVGLGILVGALTLGTATPHLVNALGGLDWRVVIATTSILTVAGGALAVVAGREGPFPFPRAEFNPRQAGRVFANRGVRLATLGYFGHMWELYAMWGWFAVFFHAVLLGHGYGAEAGAWAAIATFAVIGIGAAGCYVGGILGDRWGRTRTTAVSMGISGACALSIGWLVGASPLLVLAIGLVWGFAVVADSAQFSTMVTETADQRYVGTALTLQLAIGFTLTVATLWLVPLVRDVAGWGWAFVLLAPGPAAGLLAMLRLKASLESRAIAGGRG